MSDKLFVLLLLVACVVGLVFFAAACGDANQTNQGSQFLVQSASANEVSFWHRPELNWVIPLIPPVLYVLVRMRKR
jgi:hypothetical protein